MKLQNAIAIGLLMTGAAACGDDDTNSTTTTNAVYTQDGMDATDWDTAAMYAATDPIADPFFLAQQVGSAATSSTTITPTQAAQSAAAAADQYFSPKTCVNAKADGGQVTYTLAACQGPFGLQHIDGTLVVQFLAPDEVSVDAGSRDAATNPGAGKIGFTIKSNGATINAADASINVQGVYARTSSGDKAVTATSTSKHSRNGSQITGSTTSTATWAQSSQCVNVDATGNIIAMGNTYNLKVDNYARCTGQCPKSGTVRVTGDQTVTLTLNGSDAPTYRTNDGMSGSLSLQCTNETD